MKIVTNLCNQCNNEQCIFQSDICRNDCEFFIPKKKNEDCVSRQELLKRSYTVVDDDGDMHRVVSVKDVEDVPSVEPERKTGHWILADEQNKEDVENDNYRFICSECQCSDIHAKGTIVPYCWKCGAKMEV